MNTDLFASRQRSLSRRAFLRGTGVALALPLLDAMTPAVAALTKSSLRTAPAPGSGPVHRMVAVQTNMGILSQHFFPKDAGKSFTPTPYLEILKPYRDRLTVLSGVSHPDVDGAHEAEKSFLTAAPHPGGTAFKNTISLDQYAAEHLGSFTRFPSFTLSVNAEGPQGMAFSRSGVKVPAEKSPAALYQQMFVQGNSREVAARLNDLREGRSMMDFVSASAKRLNAKVGPADRQRLDQYFSAVRELEIQLKRAQEWERSPKPKPKPGTSPPADITDARKLIDKIGLMLDIAKLALETDSTRIITLFINTFSIVADIPGVKDETHALTHHGGRTESLDQLFLIESAQFRTLAQFFQNLDNVREPRGSLLDQTAVLYGAPMGNANSHANTNLPILLAGGRFRHAGHLSFNAVRNYPLPNMFVSMIQRLGIPADKFASSTGRLTGLELL